MATLGFEICLLISMLILIWMACKNYENINIYYWSLVVMFPIVILGYWLKSKVTTPEAAELAFCFIYIESTILVMVTIFSMVRSFGYNIRPWVKILGYGVAVGHCYLVWKCFGTKLYYESITIIPTPAGTVTKMVSGPLKFVHTIYLSCVVIAIITLIVRAFIKKGTYSRRILRNYAAFSVLTIIVYAVEMLVDVDFTVIPYLYVLADFVVAIDYDRIHTHDISCLISEQQKYYSKRGYAALDFKERFLSCNERVYDFIPFLKDQRVDETLPESETLFAEMIAEYKEKGSSSRKIQIDEVTCICEVMEFSIRRDGKKQGYLFDLRDATEEQKTLDIMTSYNETLNAEVKKKTDNIAGIQQKIVVGMANIIENRDDNTGGHVKRTSDVIKILIDEIIKQQTENIEVQLANDIVRAAPMHDLGKVTIDSSILCKKGRLDNEEYAIMKTHSSKSGEMVRILLDGVEEEHFVETAFNIARYHHERWDGKGYPEGLVGTMIPLEARIMAVADVYDALVSKRCYKEPMSFEEAREIMCQGMGTQFDPNMKKIFLSCREKLEEYYRALA